MYITNANLYRLFSKVQLKEGVRLSILEDASIKLTELLSLPEQDKLTVAEYIFKCAANHAQYDDTFNVLRAKTIVTYDSKKFVFPESKPAFHVDTNCDLIKLDYLNFPIPLAIQKKSEESKSIINTYRDIVRRYFDSKTLAKFREMIKRGDDEQVRNRMEVVSTYISAKCLEEMGIQIYKEEIVELIYNSNSGAMKIGDLALVGIAEVEMAQNQLIDYLKYLEFDSGDDGKEVHYMRWLSDFDLLHLTANKNPNIKQMAQQLSSLKKNYFDSLIEFMKNKYGFQQDKLDKDFLEKCGFQACRACMDKYPNLFPIDISDW